MKYFYSDVIKIESLLTQMDDLKLKPEHKKHLATIIDATIHTTVLDVVLSKLDRTHHKTFLQAVAQDPTDKKLLEFLNSQVPNIEREILRSVEKLKKELAQDILEVKRKT